MKGNNMYNKCLEYLLSNDSDDVMSESGIEFRKFIHPVVIRVGQLLGPDKYALIKREPERIKNMNRQITTNMEIETVIFLKNFQ